MTIIPGTMNDLVRDVLTMLDPTLPTKLSDSARTHVATSILSESLFPWVLDRCFYELTRGKSSLEADACLLATGIYSQHVLERGGKGHLQSMVDAAQRMYGSFAIGERDSDLYQNLADHLPHIVSGLQQSPLAVTSQTLEERYAHLLIGNSNYQA